MNFLVTGGAGYIGSHFCKLAHEMGHTVFILDNFSTGHEEFVKWGRYYEADLREPDKYEGFVRGMKWDAVFHFAGAALARESITHPAKYFANNPYGTACLLDVLSKTNCRKLIFSSSCSVYGAHEGPITEETELNPINPYGLSKKQAEEIVLDYRNRFGFEVAILRYFNVIGQDTSDEIYEKHHPETHILPKIMNAEAKHQPISVYGNKHDTRDGTCVRDYIDVRDIAAVHIKALEALSEGSFISNVGSGEGKTILQLLDAYRRVFGAQVQPDYKPAAMGDAPSLVASNDFFRSWYKEPLIELEDSVASLGKRRDKIKNESEERG